MQFGRRRVPVGRLRALIAKITADEKSITEPANPCAGRADADVVEIIVSGGGAERAILRVGFGESHRGRGGFEDAVVGDVAREERGVVGDANLMSGGVGHVSIDRGKSAGEGDRAVVGQAAAAEGSEAGDLTGVAQRIAAGVESSTAEVDGAGVGGKCAADEKFSAAVGGQETRS